MEPKDQVLKTMKAKGVAMKATEIAEAAGLEKKIVDKAMKELKADQSIFSPKVCYWQAK